MWTTDPIHSDKAGPPFGTTSARWRIDPDQSAASFAAATLWGAIPVTGQLGQVTGSLMWDGSAGHGQMEIAIATLSSGIKPRDHHLRTRAFFHVARHSELTFEANEIVAADGHILLRGELLVRGRRHPFECKATVEALDRERIALEAEAAFDLDQLGMSRGLFRMIPRAVKARVRVVLEPEIA